LVAPIKFLVAEDRLKMRKTQGWNQRGVCLELFFQKKFNKLPLILFLCVLCVSSFTSDAKRTFVALQFVCPITQNPLNLVKEWGKYWKVFDERYLFGDGWSTLHSQTGHERAHYHLMEQTLNLPSQWLSVPKSRIVITSSKVYRKYLAWG
jgi:hypothetical protein